MDRCPTVSGLRDDDDQQTKGGSSQYVNPSDLGQDKQGEIEDQAADMKQNRGSLPDGFLNPLFTPKNENGRGAQSAQRNNPTLSIQRRVFPSQKDPNA